MIAQLDRAYALARPAKVAQRLLSYALFEGRPATTRGRWINPAVFAHFAVAKRLPQLKRVRKPVFILGTGRSGTTALGRVLSIHRDVGFLNEPKALWHSVFAGEDVIGNYTRGPARYRLDAGDATVQVRRAAHRLFGAYLACVSARRVVDKYPELVFRVPFVIAIFPDAKFILLVRNGWDTCSSIESWSGAHAAVAGGGAADWWGVDRRKWGLLQSELLAGDPEFDSIRALAGGLRRQRDMAAVEWIVTMREGLERLSEARGSMLLVRYEELVRRPREELGRIGEFAELASDGRFLEYGERALHPTASRGEFDLDPGLRPMFMRTMRALGY